jgi:hypothetical protein
MSLFSPSANLEISTADAIAALPYLTAEPASGEALDITIHGIRFEVRASGFGTRKTSLEGALTRVQFLLAVCTEDELDDQAVLDAVAATAVRRETRGWRCWRRGWTGKRPALKISAA